MTKIIIASINSKYIHTNLAIRYIKKYLEQIAPKNEYIIKEWNLKQRFLDILRELYSSQPDTILFSIYIWNVEMTLKLIREIKKLLPSIEIAVGGPEVMYRSEELLQEYPEISQVFKGDGELALANYLGVVPKKYSNRDLDYIPFPYNIQDIERSKNQIIYYESSRGCPFNCAYCLSSIEHNVRYFSLERVLKDLDFFLTHKVKLVKFVDRTFNLDPQRYYPIWEYLIKNHNGYTTFHFEISGDLLSIKDLNLLQTAPPNALQFEAGIQSTHLPTLKAINRSTDLQKLKNNLLAIGENIHLHVDLIAGLPLENIADFSKSFDFAMSLKPDMLQLGFLKILKGTAMEKIAKSEPGYIYLNHPPYEVTATTWLSFEDISQLKDIEKTVDIFYNSGRHQLPDTSFSYFQGLAKYLKERGVYTDPRKHDYYAQALASYLS